MVRDLNDLSYAQIQALMARGRYERAMAMRACLAWLGNRLRHPFEVRGRPVACMD